MADNARFYMVGPEQKLTIPDQTGNAQVAKPWYTLFWQLYNGVTNGVSQPEEAIASSASPQTYLASIKGQLNIAGGTGLTIQFSRDGTTFYAAGAQPCMIPMCKGDRIRVTYATPPTLTFFPM
jgi:hypothetical protein